MYVIGRVVIPTMIANSFFLPRHLLPHAHEIKKTELTVQQPGTAEES